MPDTRSDAYRRFLDSFEGPIDSRERVERFDLEALAELTGAERAQAQEMLLARLQAGEIDGRVPPALAQLGTTVAFTALHEALGRHSGTMLLAILRALERMGPVDGAVDRLLGVLREGDEYARVEAANHLASQPGAPADDARRQSAGGR